MKIRSWRKTDTAVLRQIHRLITSDQPFPATRHLWLVEDEGQVVGYTAVSPVPGLPGVYNLEGGILPAHRRQGLGSRLLQHVLHEAPALNVRQLSHCVTDLNSPTAHFLRHHHFFIEHEEWLMQLPDLRQLNLPVHVENLRIHPLTRSPAHPFTSSPLHLFCQLYDQSFGGAPWYQPYSKEEVENTLDNPADILFLFRDKQPIGFAWLQEEAQEAAIEPIGIVREEWGKGYGRFLLLAALHELQHRGKTQAHIGVWRNNEAAIHLYQSVGFQHEQTLTYLAYNLDGWAKDGHV